jgi:hypothetical protein
MTDLEFALATYIGILGASADHTTRAEDRREYSAHLAEAARMFADLRFHRYDDFRRRVRAESRAYGTSFLSGDQGAAATKAFADFAQLVESNAPAA